MNFLKRLTLSLLFCYFICFSLNAQRGMAGGSKRTNFKTVSNPELPKEKLPVKNTKGNAIGKIDESQVLLQFTHMIKYSDPERFDGIKED